jgi:hypothetical protein
LAPFEEFLEQMDHQIGAKTEKNLLYIDQYVAHPRDTTALKNTEVVFFPPNCISHLLPLDVGISHAFKIQYRKQLIQKAVAMFNRELLYIVFYPCNITITGQDRTQHTHCNRHAATSITLVTEVKTNIVSP